MSTPMPRRFPRTQPRSPDRLHPPPALPHRHAHSRATPVQKRAQPITARRATGCALIRPARADVYGRTDPGQAASRSFLPVRPERRLHLTAGHHGRCRQRMTEPEGARSQQ